MKNLNVNKSKFAKLQADGIFNSLEILNRKILPKEKYIGEMITLNVMSGLCIELYLKAFLATTKKAGGRRDHNLERLFGDLPHVLKNVIRQDYATNYDDNTDSFKLSILISENLSETKLLQDKLNDFDSAIKALSTTFVDSRYFFENLNERNWIIVEYYFGYVKAICQTLKKVYEQHIRGDYSARIK